MSRKRRSKIAWALVYDNTLYAQCLPLNHQGAVCHTDARKCKGQMVIFSHKKIAEKYIGNLAWRPRKVRITII